MTIIGFIISSFLFQIAGLIGAYIFQQYLYGFNAKIISNSYFSFNYIIQLLKFFITKIILLLVPENQ